MTGPLPMSSTYQLTGNTRFSSVGGLLRRKRIVVMVEEARLDDPDVHRYGGYSAYTVTRRWRQASTADLMNILQGSICVEKQLGPPPGSPEPPKK